MAIFKRWAGYALVLLALAYGVLFAIQNTASVPLDLLFLKLPESTVAAWVLGAFVLGGGAGLAVGTLWVWRLQGRTAYLRRRVDKLNRELDGLRNADPRPALTSARSSGQAKAK